jgi:hypothetical protein
MLLLFSSRDRSAQHLGVIFVAMGQILLKRRKGHPALIAHKIIFGRAIDFSQHVSIGILQDKAFLEKSAVPELGPL